MRNFDECKAEIFSRSKARIKQRRQRTMHIALLCLPLVLCIGVFSWAFLNGIMAAKNDYAMPESAEGNQNGQQMGDMHYSTDYNNTPENAKAYPQITLHINGNSYILCNEDSKTILSILESLDYSQARVCRCLPQYRVETENGSYGLHLGEGYARCSDGQAKLTAEQVATFKRIFGKFLEKQEDVTE